MKFALVGGQRREPEPGLLGECPIYQHPMLARCGPIKVWHWAHKGKLTCDPWKENETEWHRNWKNKFPIDWQERVHKADNGEKHQADVKTDKGWVLEFQHSFLPPEERQARNSFYEKLVWVVDGTRLKRDRTNFFKLVREGVRFRNTAAFKLSGYLDDCALLRDWTGNRSPVFFDFGEEFGLWYLLPTSSLTMAYVVNLPHAYFIKLHLEGEQMGDQLDFWFRELCKLVSDYNSQLRVPRRNQPVQQDQNHANRPESFQQQFARRIFARSRTRF